MLFEAINSSNVMVPMNYGQANVCGLGPFMWIRSNSGAIDQIIDSEELIRLMTPPLQFRERRSLFITVYICLAVILAGTVAFVVYTNANPALDVTQATWVFLGCVLGLVVLQFVMIGFWISRFKVKLLEYVEGLNRDVLAARGVELYYNDIMCCGKNISRLGIRKCEASASPFKTY